MNVNKYNNFINNLFKRIPFAGIMDFKNKEENAFAYTLYMLNRTQALFRYENLPDSIPARMLELYMQVNGHCAIAKVDETLYALTGGLGGEPDPYYMPTIYTVANPALEYSANLKINEDCIVMNNDSMYIGLMPLFNRYASILAENELSMWIAIINSRLIDLIVAEDDATKESAELFLEKIQRGEFGVIGANAILNEGIKALPYSTSSHGNYLTQLIETEQYAKAAWLNDLGLNANYNMKREALSTAESQLNDDALRPLIDNMLECRRAALDKVNEMFGTEIEVELNSAWESNEIEEELELKTMQHAVDPKDPEEKENEED